MPYTPNIIHGPVCVSVWFNFVSAGHTMPLSIMVTSRCPVFSVRSCNADVDPTSKELRNRCTHISTEVCPHQSKYTLNINEPYTITARSLGTIYGCYKEIYSRTFMHSLLRYRAHTHTHTSHIRVSVFDLCCWMCVSDRDKVSCRP